MATFARASITMSGGKVRVTSGKFRGVWTSTEWSDLLARSMEEVVRIHHTSSRKSLALCGGVLFRMGAGESMEDARSLAHGGTSTTLVQEHQIGLRERPWRIAWPPPLTSLSEHQAWLLLQPFLQPLFDTPAQDPASIILRAGEQARITAERFIQRNLLGDDISRYIPQDVKIAVAIRDQGRCTAQVGIGRRCRATLELHYDHRFIPFRYGGPQRPWNLTLHCAEHNLRKSDSMPHLQALWTAIMGGRA